MGSVLISPIVKDSRRHHPIRNESDSQIIRVSTSRVVSCPSTLPNESTPSNDHSLSADKIIEIGRIYANKKELQQKLASYAIKKNFEFKVNESCS